MVAAGFESRWLHRIEDLVEHSLQPIMSLLLTVEDFFHLDIVASISLVSLLGLIRYLATRMIISKSKASLPVQRRWSATIRNILFFLGLIGLLMIWAPQLRTFALSLTAVAVALVLATKELILCFSGSFLRASSGAFSIGDRVEIGNVRGEVVDHNIFVTTLHEFEGGPRSSQFTGRTAVVPNSILLSTPVRNLSLLRNFAYHSFCLTLEPTVNIFRQRAFIEATVQRHYSSYIQEANRVNALIERRSAIDLQDELFAMRMGTSDIGKYCLTITLFCPIDAAQSLEMEIMSDLMSHFHDLMEQDKVGGQA